MCYWKLEMHSLICTPINNMFINGNQKKNIAPNCDCNSSTVNDYHLDFEFENEAFQLEKNILA